MPFQYGKSKEESQYKGGEKMPLVKIMVVGVSGERYTMAASGDLLASRKGRKPLMERGRETPWAIKSGARQLVEAEGYSTFGH